jgi:hypothetical protein
MNQTDVRYCNREDAAILVHANGHRVECGSRAAMIHYTPSFGVHPPSDQLAVYLDFSDVAADMPEASDDAQQIIRRLFPECFSSGHHNSSEAGGSGLATLGGILFFGAIVTIVICLISYAYNKAQVQNHPWSTIFSGGQNLSSYGYNFLPPWTGFEVFVLVAGVVGFLLLSANKE